jgi:predicted membrane protein
MINGLTLQYLFLIVILASTVVIASIRVGALWLRLALIDLLAAITVFIIAAIDRASGVMRVTDEMADLITLLSISVILFAFFAAYRRRAYLMRAEQERKNDLWVKHGDTIAGLESDRAMDEHKYNHNWNTMVTHRIGPR